MNPTIGLVVAVLIVGVLMLAVMSITKNKGIVLDQEKYQTRWLKIEQNLIKDDLSSYKLTILEADKLLDHALVELGITGKTMGERLKKTSDMFTSINSIWHAHKLRNQIAHEHDFEINFDQAKRALGNFRQGLKDLGAI
jgi:hypothetical protein